jgi:hypothetical protein
MLGANENVEVEASPVRKELRCPACGRAGGFEYVEGIELVSQISEDGEVRLDRAEKRYDPDEDKVRCPCGHEFPVPVGVELRFTPRED